MVVEFYLMIYDNRSPQARLVSQYHAASLLDALDHAQMFVTYGYTVNLCLEEGN